MKLVTFDEGRVGRIDGDVVAELDCGRCGCAPAAYSRCMKTTLLPLLTVTLL